MTKSIEVAPPLPELEDAYHGSYTRLRAESMAQTLRDVYLDRAAQSVASAFHELWREGRLNKDETFEPRQKVTADESWIAAHGTDQVDIANTKFKDLPADWQLENQRAARVVVDILDSRNEIDVEDPVVREEIGTIVHDAWLRRNDYARGSELDVPFAELSDSEQDKDIDQVTLAYEVLSSEIKHRNFEKRGYVTSAPTLSEAAADTSRTNIISGRRFSYPGVREYDDALEVSEQQGLLEVQEFLSGIVEESEHDGAAQELRDKAKIILENLNYIGQKEFKEATSFIAESWKRYLSANPNAQLCVIAETKNVYKVGEVRPKVEPIKSNQYVLDTVLGAFTDAELLEYGSRILTDPGDITAAIEDVKIVLLDDWTLSGRQLSDPVISKWELLQPYIETNKIEAQLITTTSDRIDTGLGYGIPVRAYYMANYIKDPLFRSSKGAMLTGSHSAGDYGFSIDLSRMEVYSYRHGQKRNIPVLAGPVAPYRHIQKSDLENVARLEAVSK